ncbi:MAG: winged helix-turn-helix domain-containing protein [Candidatus Thorarchaeota archaeon]
MDSDEREEFQISDGEIASIAEYFKAIAHPKRLNILKFLNLENTSDFSRLKKLTDLSKTALANHLSQLENLKLIKRVERGHYEITEDGKNLVHNTITLYKRSQFSDMSTRQSLSQEYMKFISSIKMLSNIEFKRYWVSQLASLHGCIEYLGVDISKPWLFGITGHAFIINIKDHICPSGPTAWKNDMIIDCAKNIGIKIDNYCAETCYPDYEEKLKNGWEFIKSSINQKNPCYGWQIGEIKEFYIIYGYDNVGYYYKGYFQEGGAGPRPWKDIGKMFIRLYSVKKANTQIDHSTQVKIALQMVLKHSRNPKDWIYKPDYTSGLEGFDRWIKWVDSGKAEQFGHAYNSRVWAECRQEAVNFLQEAKSRLNNKLKPYLDKTIKKYETVAKNLTKIADLYPFDMNKLTIKPIGVNEKSKVATNLLKKAREAEANGLLDLEKIIENLE